MVIVTTIRREVLTLPAAELGPDNPLPPLRLLHEVHRIEVRDRDELPREMAIEDECREHVLHERVAVRIGAVLDRDQRVTRPCRHHDDGRLRRFHR